MRWLAELRVRVRAAVRAGLADLHQKLALSRELQDLMIFLAVACRPDVADAVHEHAVLALRPVIALAGPAPRAQQVSIGIEFHDWRRRLTAFRGRRALHCAFLVVEQSTWTMDDPDMIVPVRGHAGDLAKNPVVRQGPWPERIGPERGRVLSERRGRYGRQSAKREDGSHAVLPKKWASVAMAPLAAF